MSSEIAEDNTGNTQFVVYIFLVLGLVILTTVIGAVFFDSVWIPALLSCTSMLIGTVVFLQLETRGRNPWLWGVGIFLIIPVIYIIIASLI